MECYLKLHIVSDLHLEHEDMILPKTDSDVIILAGDIDVGVNAIEWIGDHQFDKPVIYVPGNHEYYHYKYPTVLFEMRELAAEFSNVHVLDNDSIVIGNTLFLGVTLWTDFALYGHAKKSGVFARNCMGDFRFIKSSDTGKIIMPEQTIEWHTYSKQWLLTQLENKGEQHSSTVVISHHAPSHGSIVPRFINDELSPGFASNLEDDFKDYQIDLWIHGHMHDNLDYKMGSTRVVCNPRGYPGENRLFDEQFVVEL